MASILGNWRGYSYSAMWVLVSLAAFTTMHHPDFAPLQGKVAAGLQHFGTPQLQTQMRLPMALGILFAPGVRGAFCAIVFFGLLASQGAQLHSYGSTVLQDVILPLRKKVFGPKEHIYWLRFSVFGVAAFACLFSLLFKPVDYLIMITTLIGAIYLGGIGVVVWGGLYWKRGSTAGAWAALIIGGGLGIVFNLGQQFWIKLSPLLVKLAGPGRCGTYLATHAEKCPLNGQQLSLIIALTAVAAYFVVSLLSRQAPANMDALLHRGAYRIQSENVVAALTKKRFWLARFLDVDEHFTRGDKILTYATFAYTTFWQVVAVGILIWTVTIGQLSTNWWFNYTMVTAVWLTVSIGAIVTVWFTIGVIRDLRELFRALKNIQRIDTDDGTVRGHHNLGEEELTAGQPKPTDPSK